MISQKIGKMGEDLALKYLAQLGYKILKRNFKSKLGEIDIIAKDKEEIVFIEVKTRTNNKYGKPAEAVNKIKKEHIKNAGIYYIYSNKLNNKSIRFDVIEVYLASKNYIHHIKQIE